jgi:hypothetical protein
MQILQEQKSARVRRERGEKKKNSSHKGTKAQSKILSTSPSFPPLGAALRRNKKGGLKGRGDATQQNNLKKSVNLVEMEVAPSTKG